MLDWKSNDRIDKNDRRHTLLVKNDWEPHSLLKKKGFMVKRPK